MQLQAQTKLTSQGQVSVPAVIRKHLGLKPGSALHWQEQDGRIFVERATLYDTLAAHQALFGDDDVRAGSGGAKPKTLKELKAGVAQAMKARHARP